MSNPFVSRSAFYGLALPGRYGKQEGPPGVTIAECVNLGLATLACRKGEDDGLKASVREAYGVELPSGPTLVRGDAVSFMGTAPREWLAVSETYENESLAEELAITLSDLASVSDQSSGRAVIRLSGPCARDVLAKGLAVDLDPRVFAPCGAVTATISHMGVQLWQADQTQSYDIALSRSMAASFWQWLTSSAAACGYEVTP